jgi:hypothetical protein
MILRFRTLFGFLAVLSLFSCGGGGSLSRDDSAGGTTGSATVTITRSISLAFTDDNGQPSTSLSESTPLTLTATATDSNGDPVTSTLITYRFQPEGLAVLVMMQAPLLLMQTAWQLFKYSLAKTLAPGKY